MNLELLKTLCRLPGVSGREDAVRDYLRGMAQPVADRIETDAMGNLMVFRKGRRSDKTLMLAAHMDEVGVIITGMTGDGYLKFDFVGGVDRRVVLGKQVLVGEKKLPGIIGMKAFHLSPNREEVPPVSALYLDIGAKSREEAEQLVTPGEIGVMIGEPVQLGGDLLKAKAIDDRLGCGVLAELMTGETPAVDTWFVFTTQEEVGTRGVAPAVWRIQPDAAIVVEGTTAADLPGVPEHKTICHVGKGAVLPFMDRGTVYDRKLREKALAVAAKHGIPTQTKQMIAGGTDASVIQRSAGAVPVIGIAAALRNIHSPASIGSISDFNAVYWLTKLMMTEIFKENEET